jgi:deferrochelatase/peroxidase EfeB
VSGPKFTRKRFVAVTGGGALGIAAGGAGGYLLSRDDDGTAAIRSAVPFHGAHQAGIVTAAQDRIVFGAFDLQVTSRGELAALLRDWTTAAATMTAGEPLGKPTDLLIAPAVDTGEAMGLPAAQLTVTFGLGPGIFDAGRFGLEDKRPDALVPLPHFAGDALDPDRSGGDLCVQACSDDPVVAFHTIRNLARIASGRASLRWTQLGFGRTSTTTSGQVTLRNLQGFKDGTNNLRGEDKAEMEKFVWVGDDEPQAWLRGGTYLVARRIRMHVEIWDNSALGDQQNTIGRYKLSGAPLTGVHEHDVVQLDAKQPDGKPVIPLNAHIRLAGPAGNGGERILRRGYSFADGIDPETGELDAGLFFVAFQRDPRKQFIPIQRRLAASDALNEYIVHTGSALFAVPPGVERGRSIGEALLG